MNNLDSWRVFLRHVKWHKFVFGLGGPLHPRPNLLFSKMTVVSFYNENPVRGVIIGLIVPTSIKSNWVVLVYVF